MHASDFVIVPHEVPKVKDKNSVHLIFDYLNFDYLHSIMKNSYIDPVGGLSGNRLSGGSWHVG